MKTWIATVILTAALCLAAPGAVPEASAQPRGVSVGLEAGLPLVFGVDASFTTHPRWRLGAGFGRLSGLTVIRGEARWLLLPEQRGRLVPSLLAGLEQYFLEDGDLDATPLGMHAAFGLDYRLDSPVSLTARFGGLKTFGSSDGEGARVFSIRNDYATGLFNVGLRYHF